VSARSHPPSLRQLVLVVALGLLAGLLADPSANGWTPQPVATDPLVRLPGTQPGLVTLEGPDRCLNCHSGYDGGIAEPGHWQGSMMAQSARDFLFWATLTVAAQDSIWAAGRPNATDLCLRCHFPEGWLEGRSDPTNGSDMTDSDFDGVHCDSCHRLYDPFFETTFNGSREGSDWESYWDETNASDTPSDTAAQATHDQDALDAATVLLYDGDPFYDSANLPVSPAYTENAGGQFFVSSHAGKRASFADAEPRHDFFYSRYHKSRYFCSTCHDVSNPLFVNLAVDGTPPGDGTTVLPSEANAAFSYGHVERTFSEFSLSAFGVQGGAPGEGPWAPDSFDTSLPGDAIGKCQDCHLPDVAGRAAKQTTITRPGSTEHPQSGVPEHDLTGANTWVSRVLASAISGSPNYDATNDALLHQGAAALTLDLTKGLGIDPVELLAGAARAEQTLSRAAALRDLSYDPDTGAFEVEVVNYTGHKLLSGYPEGRRMVLNLKLYSGGSLIYEVNPYDTAAGTLAGLPDAPSSPPLGPNQAYADDLVYEMRTASSLTGGGHTFHFLLADSRQKDNRIPPKGFRIAEAAARIATPVTAGSDDPGRFTAEEYAGGYDEVDLTLPAGADRVEARLTYQTTSREYVEFLRDEIEGTASTLTSPTPSGEPEAYIAQTDPFFSALAAWGDTIWQLWLHNKDVPGAAPIVMAEAALDVGGGAACTPGLTLDDGRTVATTETYTSCDTLTAGPFHAVSPGDVTFRAASSIVLGSGFSVGSGASFRAVIDPTITPP